MSGRFRRGFLVWLAAILLLSPLAGCRRQEDSPVPSAQPTEPETELTPETIQEPEDAEEDLMTKEPEKPAEPKITDWLRTVEAA
ncbi:MAG: hypothetical protein K6A33_11345, partial [Clostridiales bacterium]|nr:hypothetical protein [Clostridiales bacterium]